jgi:site-specific DNA-methyltransferase (adenine-specific)
MIHYGDCLDVLRTIEAGSVNLCFADPPYNIGIEYDQHNDLMTRTDFLNWCDCWIDSCVCRLADDGSMWVLINDEWVADFSALMRIAGLKPRNWVIWYETFGVNCTNKFNRTKRHLLYMTKDPKRFTFNRAAVTVPSARLAKYGDKRANLAGKVMDDVWTIPRVCGTFKERIKGVPTQLPLELLRRIVGCSSNPGDLVVDPFTGSGSTPVVCQELGRRFIGAELSAAYIEIARKRLADHAGQSPALIPLPSEQAAQAV